MEKNKLEEKVKKVTHIETVTTPVAKQRRYTFEIILFLVLMGFAVLTFFAKVIAYFTFDLPITQAIQNFHPAWFNLLMKGVTKIGNPIEGSLITLFFILGFLLLKKLPEALTLGISVVGVTFLSMVFKTYVSRPRPDPTLILQIGTYGNSDSFPSGHVLYAIGLFGFLLFLVFTKFKRGMLRSILIFSLTLVIILMGMSRIYMGAHWFSDTLGSYLIGIVWIYLMIFIFKKISPKKV